MDETFNSGLWWLQRAAAVLDTNVRDLFYFLATVGEQLLT